VDSHGPGADGYRLRSGPVLSLSAGAKNFRQRSLRPPLRRVSVVRDCADSGWRACEPIFRLAPCARLVRAMDRGQAGTPAPLSGAIALGLFLAVVGIAMAIYLISLRDPAQAGSTLRREVSMAADRGNGILSKASNHAVDETLGKLKGILQAKGVTVFAVVDHSGEAEKAGLKMRPTKLVLFGNPKAGTPLMLAAPSAAIDLPLKILIWEDAQGKVWVSYNSPAYLEERHGFPKELLQNIAVVETLAAAAGA